MVPECQHGPRVWEQAGFAEGVWLCPLTFGGCDDLKADKVEKPDVKLGRWQTALRDAACDKTLTLPVKGIGFILATYATTATGRGIFPKQKKVAEAAGICRQQVNKHIGTLVKLGWLTEEKRLNGGVRVYRLTLPAVV